MTKTVPSDGVVNTSCRLRFGNLRIYLHKIISIVCNTVFELVVVFPFFRHFVVLPFTSCIGGRWETLIIYMSILELNQMK